MKWLKIGVFLIALLSVATSAPILFADVDPSRLPKTSIPLSYDLHLTTNVDTSVRAYSGVVKIAIKVTEETKVITLHNHELNIDSVRLLDSASTEIPTTHSLDAANDFLLIDSGSKSLIVDELLTVEVEFNGLLQLGTSGFYRSSYRVGNVLRYLAVTQFEESEARRAFICYDEPEYKAKFKLSITHSSSYKAISNTEGTVVVDGETTTTSFATTPRMSSYLLAFVVADFDSITNKPDTEPGDVIHTAFALSKDVENTRFGMESAAKFLKALEAYTSYDYELPHMFSAAIPDFGSSAMENWGFTMFKEQFLIVKENAHPRETFDSMRIIANVMGHQFFGNVVTCKFWDQLWLNEGFGAFFEYSLIDLAYPGSRANDLLNVQKLQNAFLLDKESAHPMNWYGDGYIYGMYYDKTVSILRMFQHAIGEDKFRAALNAYLTANEYGSVTSDDLYAAFDSVLDEDEDFRSGFLNAFRAWETEIGFPLVHVSIDEARETFTVTQNRYFAAADVKVENDDRTWFFPLNFATSSDPDFEDTSTYKYFNYGHSDTISLPAKIEADQWFIFNKQQLGYYRVNYDEGNWREIIKTLKSENFKQIHVLNRAQLIDDSLNLAADGYLSYEIAFEVLSYLERETDYIPWKSAVNNLEKLDFIMKDRPVYEWFKIFVRKLARRAYLAHGWEEKPGESLMDKYARELVIDWTCRVGDENCLAKTYETLKLVTAEAGESVPASLEISYICNGLRGLNKKTEFASLFKRMQDSNDQSERLRIIDGLTCSSDPEVLLSLLQTTIVDPRYFFETNYKSHERQRVLTGVYTKSSVGIAVMANFLSEFYMEAFSDSFFSQSTVKSIIIGMSKRAVQYDDQVILTELMDKLLDLGLFDEVSKTQALKNIDDNKVLIESSGFFAATSYLYYYYQDIVEIENQLRLPKTSLPSRYKIHIDARNVHTTNTAFSGEIEIETSIKVETNYIIIHSKKQRIHELKVWKKIDLSDVPVVDYDLYPEADTLTIYFTENIPVDTELVVNIKYSANLLTSANGFGFYQTSYAIDGVTHYMAATNFESSVSSRYAFPHYDEPGFKAVFELRITHDPSVHAISNMPENAPTPNDDGTVTTAFDPTPNMASYLLAFIVSDLENISNAEGLPVGDTLHRIWVRPDAVSRAGYALENSVNALKALEAYVGHKFALPKCDSAGVPLKTGAMENWGMVTYRENAMIYEQNYDDIPHTQKFSGVSVISHELAHQFFGDLVTMEWWSYIWLNEGFATLFEYQITGEMHPEWRIRDFFNTRTIQYYAFRSDSEESTRPMTTDLTTIDEIKAAFDDIAYDKAGSVLRMFQNAVGDEIFKEGLNLYLETNKYQSVNSQHLINAMNASMVAHGVNNFNFERAFQSWEYQKGFPIIDVRFVEEANAFIISQERFYTNKKEFNTEISTWHIPINIAIESEPNFDDTTFTHYIDTNVAAFLAPEKLDASQWFIFNKQQMGYYRVNYDFANWHALIVALNSDDYDKIHVLNRAQLIDDSLNFAAGGYLDYEVAFGILEYLSRETEYTAWYPADRFISSLYSIFGTQNEVLNEFVHRLSEKLYESFKIPNGADIPLDGLYERYNREIALKIACNSGNPNCLADTALHTKLFAENNLPVPKGLETVIYCNGLKGVDKQTTWVAMWWKMQSGLDVTVKAQLINALGCSDDTEVLEDFLESTLGSSNTANYTQAERHAVISSMVNSNNGLKAVVDFMEKYELDIIRSFGYGTLEAMISVPARAVKSKEQFTIFSTFLQTLSHLEDDEVTRVNNIVNSNLRLQQQSKNVNIMRVIRRTISVTNEVENQLRLPETSAPQRYRLHIDARNIQTGDRAFTGEVEIDVVIKQPTDYIMFHSKNQEITEFKVFNKDMSELSSLYHLYPETDTITIYFTSVLVANTEITVHIKYSTALRNPTADGYGFYQSSYDVDGETRYFASTQFEPSRARFAFPHYDEPGFKAVFELKITHDTSRHAISNTFGDSEENDDLTITTSFEPTPIMSSYLLAFIVSDFEHISNDATKLPGETLHRIWVRPNATEKAKFALKTSIDCLNELEKYVDFKYKMPKIDSTGEPNSRGAMENWGMIIYRENAMVYEDDIAHDIKWSGVGVIAHELSHQFFGNSVTMKWWDYIWLNEGFATLFDYMIPGILYPEWRMRDFFNLLSVQYYGFQRDARESTMAMTTPTLTLEEISDAFSSVAYDKAGAVLRMFQYAVGEDVFRAALHLYLTENEFKSVTSQELIDAIETTMRENEVENFIFGQAFKTWELQKGFPVIHVTFNETGKFEITQQRFFTIKKEASADSSSWYIPLNFATQSNPNFDDTTITNYFIDHQEVYRFDAPPQFTASQWFVFNKQQLGYYRVNYDFANWHALILALNREDFDKIHVLNRAQLVDDSLNLAAGEYLDFEVAFGILNYLEREIEYTPWSSAELYLDRFYRQVGPWNDDLNTLVRYLSTKFYDHYKIPAGRIPDEGVYERYGRELAMKIACKAGNKQCLSDTYVQVYYHVQENRSIPSGLEHVIFCSGLKGVEKQGEWLAMWTKMQASRDSEYRSMIIDALGCSEDPLVLKDYLESTLGSDNSVNYDYEERIAVLEAVLQSSVGLQPVLNFISSFEKNIMGVFNYNSLEQLLTVPARSVKTAEQQAIFSEHLMSLENLDLDVFRRLIDISDEYLEALSDPQNAKVLEIIHKIVISLPEIDDTTTIQPTTLAPTTTVSTTQKQEETTTQGSASLGFRVITLITTFMLAFVLKH